MLGCEPVGKQARQAALYPRVSVGQAGFHSEAATAAAARCGVGSGEGRGEVVEFRARFAHFPRRLEPGAAGRAPAARARQGQPRDLDSAQRRGLQELCGRRFAFSFHGTGADRDPSREGQNLGHPR